MDSVGEVVGVHLGMAEERGESKAVVVVVMVRVGQAQRVVVGAVYLGLEVHLRMVEGERGSKAVVVVVMVRVGQAQRVVAGAVYQIGRAHV